MAAPSKDPRVTIVVLNYNGLRYLEDCLSSVLADDELPREIILADNASSDGSVDYVREHFPQVRLIANEENLGFARACNQAARTTDTEYVLLLNMDTKVERGWLRPLVEALDSHPNAVIAGSKLFLGDGIHLQHAGGLIHANLNSTHIGYNELDDGRFDELRPVSYVTGASMLIRRSFLEEVGYLDETYPLYYEDTDLCIQAQRLRRDILFVPASRGIHYETVGTRRNSFRYTYRFHRGRVLCVLKNFNMRQVVNCWMPAEKHWRCSSRPLENPHAIVCAYLVNLVKLPGLLWRKRFGNYRDLLRQGWDFRPD